MKEEKDYSKLEGKEVTVIDRFGTTKGIVTGCDPDIGITIMDLAKKEYKFCLIGPSASNYKHHHEETNKPAFNYLVEKIESGRDISVFDFIKFCREITNDPYLQTSGIPSAASCPFSQ